MRMARPNPFAGLEEIVKENEPLAPHTWYRIGGPARWYVQPRTPEELQPPPRDARKRASHFTCWAWARICSSATRESMARCFGSMPNTGGTSATRKTFVEAGAGVDMQKLLLRTVRQGLAGIECLAGIPGTLGGGVRMNAGGKFGDLGAVVTRVQVMDSAGVILSAPRMTWCSITARQTSPPRSFSALRWIWKRKIHGPIMERTKQIWMFKRNTQPLNTKNAGCIFKNPRGLGAAP